MYIIVRTDFFLLQIFKTVVKETTLKCKINLDIYFLMLKCYTSIQVF
jgi:hypothetical protein